MVAAPVSAVSCLNAMQEATTMAVGAMGGEFKCIETCITYYEWLFGFVTFAL